MDFSVAEKVFGRPELQVQTHNVPSYEELHAEVQSILVPAEIPAGIQVNAVQDVTKNVAVSARMFLKSEKKEQNPFAAMMGGGAPKPPSQSRIFGLGGILTHKFGGGAGFRLFGHLDNYGTVKSSLLLRTRVGAGPLTITGQAAGTLPKLGDGMLGAAAQLRGADYTAVVRAATDSPRRLPDVGISYLQRLSPGSQLSLGGELWLLPAALRAALAPPGAAGAAAGGAGGPPVTWTVGGALDSGVAKSGVHIVAPYAAAAYPLVHLHHLYRMTERTTLVSKLIFDLGFQRSMVRGCGHARTHGRGRGRRGYVVAMMRPAPSEDAVLLLSCPPSLPHSLTPSLPRAFPSCCAPSVPSLPSLPPAQAAAGYHLRFRNTETDVTGMVDTYGGARVRVERPIADKVRATFFLHYNAAVQGGADGANAFGVKFTVGAQPVMPLAMSPATMNRAEFRIQ